MLGSYISRSRSPCHVPAGPVARRYHPELAEDFALFERILGFVPNSLLTMHDHWNEEQIVEILAAVSLYGFLNRWNDSMATSLEDSPRALGERVLEKGGWSGGKHVADDGI